MKDLTGLVLRNSQHLPSSVNNTLRHHIASWEGDHHKSYHIGFKLLRALFHALAGILRSTVSSAILLTRDDRILPGHWAFSPKCISLNPKRVCQPIYTRVDPQNPAWPQIPCRRDPKPGTSPLSPFTRI